MGRLASGDEGMATPGGMVGRRILMADDAPGNRELVSAILRGLGLEIDTVCDGAEAVQAMQTGSYDLVWQISILLSLLAAALNWPVRERPVARLQAQTA